MNFNIYNKIIITIALSLIINISAYADTKIANINITEQSIVIEGLAGFKNVLFKVSGPNGFYVENYLGNETISMVIEDLSSLKNGYYNYELTATIENSRVDSNNLFRNGRETQPHTQTAGASQAGHFLIKDGQVIISNNRFNHKRMHLEGADHDEI